MGRCDISYIKFFSFLFFLFYRFLVSRVSVGRLGYFVPCEPYVVSFSNMFVKGVRGGVGPICTIYALITTFCL